MSLKGLFLSLFLLPLLASSPLHAQWDEEWQTAPAQNAYLDRALDQQIAEETSCLKRVLLVGIRIYHFTLSGRGPSRCVFYPSCSRYSFEAIRRYGSLKGLCMTGERLFRCNEHAYEDFYVLDSDHGLLIDPPENNSLGDAFFKYLNF